MVVKYIPLSLLGSQSKANFAIEEVLPIPGPAENRNANRYD